MMLMLVCNLAGLCWWVGCNRLSTEEMETVWQYRHYLYSKPTALPRILQAKGAHGWDWASLADLRALLAMWPPLHPTQAFELLLPQWVCVCVFVCVGMGVCVCVWGCSQVELRALLAMLLLLHSMQAFKFLLPQWVWLRLGACLCGAWWVVASLADLRALLAMWPPLYHA